VARDAARGPAANGHISAPRTATLAAPRATTSPVRPAEPTVGSAAAGHADAARTTSLPSFHPAISATSAKARTGTADALVNAVITASVTVRRAETVLAATHPAISVGPTTVRPG
jgi:hypothetical protein